jgi:hypothetical protein
VIVLYSNSTLVYLSSVRDYIMRNYRTQILMPVYNKQGILKRNSVYARALRLFIAKYNYPVVEKNEDTQEDETEVEVIKWDGQENAKHQISDMEYPDDPVPPAKKSKRLNDDDDDDFIINEDLEEKVECNVEDSESPKYNTKEARECTEGI